ncbi:HAMP domain-containing sensor histidine kinase [Paenibacillus sp. IB182496]|uniref:Signal transduction histidine-protein kinase ArlS n=1 Tax=Paenibacillus sabuli TaxID=2772509 RepID=A0A927BR56_9BACL|nr:HAMP domain-containing histidine kinase [Paenibacillus sabuli]MBD2843968.1 HAMP domain-containing sensor histidine kinase [Paenibacillus sabuli]
MADMRDGGAQRSGGLPIKWKLTLGAAAILLALFAVYTFVQYVFVERYTLAQEKAAMRGQMNEVLNGLLEKELRFEARDAPAIRTLLQRYNEPGQLIRLVDNDSRVVVAEVSRLEPEVALEPRPIALSELEVESGQLLVMRSPLTIFDDSGTVEIVRRMEDYAHLNAAILHLTLWFGLGAVLLSALGGRLLAWRLLAPLQGMADTIRDVARKGLRERMPVARRNDELTALTKLFNGMMDEVERGFVQQRQFVEDASHELRTPLAILSGHLGLLRRWGREDPEILEESLSIAVEEVARLQRLVDELLQLARAEQEAERPEAAHTPQAKRAAAAVLRRFVAAHPQAEPEAELEAWSETELAVGEGHLEQMLLIVLDNAVKYSPGTPQIAVRAERAERGDGLAWLHVADRGLGIPAADLPYVWDRFYRVDKARSRRLGGNGLGLAIARRLVESAGGRVAITSREGIGTTVSLGLPVRTDRMAGDDPASGMRRACQAEAERVGRPSHPRRRNGEHGQD